MNVLTATESDRISIGTMETVTGVDASTGVSDAGKVVVLDADGKVDASMLPATITVSEANASGDVTITTANTYYAAPGAQMVLEAGTYILIGKVTVGRTATTAVRYTVRIRDTTNSLTLDESEIYMPSVNPHYATVSLFTPFTALGSTTIQLQATANQATSCVIKADINANGTGVNQATRIMAIKIL